MADLERAAGDLKLDITDESNWVFCIIRSERKISVSRGAAELLWCASYAYVELYTRIAQTRAVGGPLSLNLRDDARTARAARLLQWAFEIRVRATEAPWPSDLPRPIEEPPKGSPENVADELALVAAAYLLHHELAHDYLKHAEFGDDVQVEQEKDADHFATDWLLKGLPETDDRFLKRALGVATAWAMLTAVRIHEGSFDEKRHPRSFDRLVHTLDRYVRDPYHLVWAYVIAVLKLHIDNAKTIVVPDDRVYESFRECLEEYVEQFAAVPRADHPG
jgi:hypothetical protein